MRERHSRGLQLDMLRLRKPLLGESVDLVQVGPKLFGTAMLKVEVEEAIFLAGCDKFLQLRFIVIKEIDELDSGEVRRGNIHILCGARCSNWNSSLVRMNQLSIWLIELL